MTTAQTRKQLQPRGDNDASGKSGGPMRPVQGTLKINSNFTLPTDTGTIDWSNASSELTPVHDLGPFFDDLDQVSISGNDVTFGPGTWLIKLYPAVENTVGGDKNVQLGITLANTGTLLANSKNMTVPGNVTKYIMRPQMVALVSDATATLNFKAVQNTATAGTRILAGQFASYEKITNPSEYE